MNQGTSFGSTNNSLNRSGIDTTFTSVTEVSRITVVGESDSDEEYISTVEDSSNITLETTAHQQSTRATSCTSTRYGFRNIDDDKIQMSKRDPKNARRKATIKKLNLVNNTPELTPLLIRVNPIHRPIQLTIIKNTYVSTPEQVIHLVQAKKHIVKPQIVFSLENSLKCYEIIPSFGIRRAEQEFILTPEIQNVKVLILPSKQKIKMGSLSRKASTPELLLPPEGPHEAKMLYPLWDTITFTIALGKHVAIEYSIPQVPMRQVKQYKAEKHLTKYVDSSILYRDPPKEKVVLHQVTQVYHLRLSTVECQDPQLVQIVKIEQNRRNANVVNTPNVNKEMHAMSGSKTIITEKYRPSYRK